MAHRRRAGERAGPPGRRRHLTLGGAAVPAVDPGPEHRYPRRWPEAPRPRSGTGATGLIAQHALLMQGGELVQLVDHWRRRCRRFLAGRGWRRLLLLLEVADALVLLVLRLTLL